MAAALALDVVGRTVARVSVEEHMANYQAARALMGKGRNAGEGAAGISRNGLRKQTARLSKSSAKKAAKKSAVTAPKNNNGTRAPALGPAPIQSHASESAPSPRHSGD